MKLTAVVLAFILSVGCTVNKSDFDRLMRQEGITNYQDNGYSVFGCSENDVIKSKFSGDKNGVHISGVVCGGAFKSYTIRYD